MVPLFNIRQENLRLQIHLLCKCREEFQMDFMALFSERSHVNAKFWPVRWPLARPSWITVMADVERLFLVRLAFVAGSPLGRKLAMEGFCFSGLDIYFFGV